MLVNLRRLLRLNDYLNCLEEKKLNYYRLPWIDSGVRCQSIEYPLIMKNRKKRVNHRENVIIARMIRILYLPPYYENHFHLALDRLIPANKHVEYRVFTIEKKFITKDRNFLLSICRTIIQEESIEMIISDSDVGQLIVAKLSQEYPRINQRGMNFFNTLKCINRGLMAELFSKDECLPTLIDDMTNSEGIQLFFDDKKFDGYVKSVYGLDNQVAGFRFSDWKTYEESIGRYINLYQQQHTDHLLSLFRVYVSQQQYPSIFQSSYLIQPFFDLVSYPHWRLVIANACIYNKEIIMWPLVDGYCGWPFLAEKPLAILPILICPSRQLTSDQQTLVYTRFRHHLNHLITNYDLQYGWIECSYFISCTNEIRLISIKPTYSVYLTEAFNATNQYGDPIDALVHIANHQRPQTPILNEKTIYIHRLWTNLTEKSSIDDLINMKEIKRIHRSNSCLNRYVRIRFREGDMIDHDNQHPFHEIGFIQTYGEYYEIGLTNIIQFRSILLKKPELFPFAHLPSLSNTPPPFNPITCLPSDALLTQLEELRKREGKDLI